MASSDTMPTSLPSNSLSPITSLVSSFHLLRSNPKQTLLLLFVSLLPSSLSPFSAYIPINPLLLESFSFPYRLTYTKVTDYGISHLTINCSTKLISTIFLCFFLSFIPLAPTLRTLYGLMTTTTTCNSKSHFKATLSTFSARLCVVALDLTYKSLIFMLVNLEFRYLPSIRVLSLSTIIFGSIFGEFLRLVWVLSLVAAVAEEDRCCGGVAAVRRTVELVVSGNGGKYGWRQILGFSACLYLFTNVVYSFLDLALFYVGSGVVGRAVWGVVLVAVIAAFSLLTLAVQVALYCELKKSSEEEGDYVNLAAADHPIRVDVIDG